MAINRSPAPPLPKLFIGSSSEGMQIAKDLERSLSGAVRVVRWDKDVFRPSSYVLPSLLTASTDVDFAVLVATPDDMTEKRGESIPVARDNIILEFGLFAGALGLDRTFLLAAGELDLPSDILGLTRLPFRHGAVGRAAVSDAAYDVEQEVAKQGSRWSNSTAARTDGELRAVVPPGTDPGLLTHEIDVLAENAVAQGWKVRTNSPTTLRLTSPKGRGFSFSKSTAAKTRTELRRFVRELRGYGLRVNNGLRRPAEDAPW